MVRNASGSGIGSGDNKKNNGAMWSGQAEGRGVGERKVGQIKIKPMS